MIPPRGRCRRGTTSRRARDRLSPCQCRRGMSGEKHRCSWDGVCSSSDGHEFIVVEKNTDKVFACVVGGRILRLLGEKPAADFHFLGLRITRENLFESSA